MIDALVFDFDGLILDTEWPELCSWQEIWERHGATLTLEAWAACIGTVDGFDAYGKLEEAIGRPVDRERIRRERRARHDELVGLQTLSPGVVAYLDAARELGLATAIASSSTHAWVEGHLARLGLRDRLDVVCGRDDAGSAKPDPAVYRLALQRLGADPGRTLAFEDSPHGISAAKAAGIFCVAVPCSLTAGLDLSGADLRLASLDEIPLRQLLEVRSRPQEGRGD